MRKLLLIALLYTGFAQAQEVSIAIGSTAFGDKAVGFDELPTTRGLSTQISIGTDFYGLSYMNSTAFNSLEAPHYRYSKHSALLYIDYDINYLFGQRDEFNIRYYIGMSRFRSETPDLENREFGRATPSKVSKHTTPEVGIGLSWRFLEASIFPITKSFTVGFKLLRAKR